MNDAMRTIACIGVLDACTSGILLHAASVRATPVRRISLIGTRS
jgi:hypothetical protein